MLQWPRYRLFHAFRAFLQEMNEAPITDHVGAAVKNVTSVIYKLDVAHLHNKDDLHGEYDLSDDTSGRALDHKLAVEAKLEMEFFRKMKVYDEVPRASAAADGCKVISTRWVDINKGDQKSPNYRARLVGRELKMASLLDLFAATPPLEVLRLICSVCVNNQGCRRPYRIMTVDVK